MGYFYFDESIQERAGFIVGAFVYSTNDLMPSVFSALAEAGLQPGVDEFKSGVRMAAHPEQAKARDGLRELLMDVRVGVIVVPSSERLSLGTEALVGLTKIINANDLTDVSHQVFFDEGIVVDRTSLESFHDNVGAECDINLDQDSRTIGGIQLADLAAHAMGIMLLEQQEHIKKTVKAGENSGYEPDLDINLGFELWASLRYSFFKSSQPIPGPEDPLGDLLFDVENYGLHVAATCVDALRNSSLARFGQCYLGCIH
ncbi:hypothetical protein IIA15_03285 [candidate division TA06 bacterium]|nr:hypothetical protein [candidate division TA06 bacterium]